MNELEAHTEAVVDVEQVKSRGSCHVTGGAWSAVELNLQRRRVNLPALAGENKDQAPTRTVNAQAMYCKTVNNM